jgi:hypothetical protein
MKTFLGTTDRNAPFLPLSTVSVTSVTITLSDPADDVGVHVAPGTSGVSTVMLWGSLGDRSAASRDRQPEQHDQGGAP